MKILKTTAIFITLFTLSIIFTTPLKALETKMDAELSHAKEAFRRYCVACHGRKGKGDGKGARISGILPRDLTNGAYLSLLTDDELYQRIKYGEDRFPYLQMPGWDSSLSGATITGLVRFIRTIQEPREKLEGSTPAQREKDFKDPFKRGQVYYMRYCSPCHGVSGDGKGWAARSSLGKPVAHNDPIVMNNLTRQQIFEHVRGLKKKDDRNMPIFTGTITPRIVKDISNYTKTLSQNLK